MPSKHSTASDTATPNRAAGLSEIYIGGAGDTYSRLVASYAEARARAFGSARHSVRYFAHFELPAALRHARHEAARARTLAVIGHSWGADSALRLADKLDAEIALLVGADPVGKPDRLRVARPPGVARLIHIDALPHGRDRSDIIKSVGRLLGGVPKAFLDAEIQIETPFNHAWFWSMMRSAGEDGRSAEDWIGGLVPRIGSL